MAVQTSRSRLGFVDDRRGGSWLLLSVIEWRRLFENGNERQADEQHNDSRDEAIALRDVVPGLDEWNVSVCARGGKKRQKAVGDGHAIGAAAIRNHARQRFERGRF